MYNVLHMIQTPEIRSGLNLHELYKTPTFWIILIAVLMTLAHTVVGALPTTVEIK